MYIILAIIAFGILIGIHEFGHFLAAKAFGVKVNEFAIGMGPQLLKKQGRETLYSLRLLPIGGFCAMEGEDEASDNPRAFTSQRVWKKLIILAAGAFMNFVLGLVVILIMFSSVRAVATNQLAKVEDAFPNRGESGITDGDIIYSINGARIYYSQDFSTMMSRDTDGKVDLVIIRNGEKLRLDDFPMERREYENEDGTVTLRYGISFAVKEIGFGGRIRYSFYQAFNFVRLIRFSLADLFSGVVGIRDLSGPVGIVSTINDVAQESETRAMALENIAYLCAFIAINLAVMNLLPIPALDGGRIFLMIVTAIIELFSRKKIDPKYEGYIHTGGMVLLLGLMAFVMVNDILRIING